MAIKTRVKKINIYEAMAIIAVLMLYASMLSVTNKIVGYLDDIVALFWSMIFALRFRGRITKQNVLSMQVLLLSVIICVIGIVSNCFSQIIDHVSYIIIDMFSFMKIWLVFIGALELFRDKKIRKNVINVVARFSKLFLWISSFFLCLNLTHVIILIEENTRYGLNPFKFIFKNASHFGVLLGISLTFIIYSNVKHKLLYEILAMILMASTLKGMSLIILLVYVILRALQTKKIKIWQIICLAGSLCVVLRYQIYSYLVDVTAPRAMLIKYGIVTAGFYFPFGSGFATYGSDMAGRHYSPLYVQYGFTSRLSLQYLENTALNDAYLGMSLGQFGFIGTVLLLLLFIVIGVNILRVKVYEKRKMYIAYALFTCFCGMAVMAGSIKVGSGELIMLCIAIYICDNNSRKIPKDL